VGRFRGNVGQQRPPDPGGLWGPSAAPPLGTRSRARAVGSGKYIVASGDDATGHHDVVTFTIQLVSASGDNAGDLAWAARVFLVLDDEDRVREDYQLTVKPLAS